jgi:hypothetical protein
VDVVEDTPEFGAVVAAAGAVVSVELGTGDGLRAAEVASGCAVDGGAEDAGG